MSTHTNEYKVGQKVRMLKDYDVLKSGHEYEIRITDNGSNRPVQIVFSGGILWPSQDCFELVNDIPAKDQTIEELVQENYKPS